MIRCEEPSIRKSFALSPEIHALSCGMPRFGDPLMSVRARRAIFLECQNHWDQRVAQLAGYAGHTNHLTVLEQGFPQEYVVIKRGPQTGTKLRYPVDLEAELHEARQWAKKKQSKLPGILGPG